MLGLEEKSIQTSLGEIKYFDTNTKAPVLLCLHGNSLSKEVFVYQFQRFANYFRVIAPDLPGFGHSFRSQSPEKEYTISSMTSVIREFLTKLEVEQVTIFGWSLGGHIGIELLHQPGLIQHLITFGTPLVTKKNPADAFVLHPEFNDLFLKPSYTEEEAKIFLSGACKSILAEPKLIEATMHADGKARNTVFNSILSGEYDQASTAENAQVPITLILGDKDPVINFGYEQKRLGSLFTIFENAEHDGFYAFPQRFNEFLADLLVSGHQPSIRSKL